MYSRFYTRCFVIGAIIVLGWLLVQFLEPFWAPLGWAAILAFLLYPLHKRLTKKLRNKAGYSAGILTGLTPFFIILPIVGFGIVFAQQVTLLIEYLRERQFGDYQDILAQARKPAAWWAECSAGSGPTCRRPSSRSKGWFISGAQNLLKGAAAVGGTFAIGVVGTLVSFILMLFLLFFFPA